MSNLSISSFSLQDVRRALSRHKRKAIGFFALTVMITLTALVVSPRKYRSEGKLFVRPSVQAVTKDPTLTKDQSISINQSREIEINSIVEILRSEVMTARVVEALGSETILDLPLSEGKSEKRRGIEREKAIKQLAKDLEVSAPKLSTVIDVRCDAQSPELAQQIVAALLEAYIQEHLDVNRTDGSYDFFKQQTQLLRTQLERETEELRDTKNLLGLASIDGKRQSLQDQVSAIESQMISTETQLSTAQAKADALRKSITLLPQVVHSSEVTGFANQAADGMRQQLALLRVREQELKAKYTDEHPQVTSIKAQVAELAKLLANEDPGRTQSTTSANPARQKLEVDLLLEESLLASLSAQANKLRSQHATALAQLRELNSTEVRIADLQRKVNMTEQNYHSYAGKLEQARVHHELETKRISNVSIVQPATFTSKPVSPKTAIVLILGLFLATTGGFAVAMLAEMLDRSLRTREEIEAQLELPVLVSIPRVSARNVLLN